jgi:hypothetical protein
MNQRKWVVFNIHYLKHKRSDVFEAAPRWARWALKEGIVRRATAYEIDKAQKAQGE